MTIDVQQLVRDMEEYVENNHISKNELARRLGMSRQNLYLILNGTRVPTIETYLHIYGVIHNNDKIN